MDECFEKDKNNFIQKIVEYISFKENIENRIVEIESFYESHFDEPFVLNYEQGIIQLKNLLNENKPNCENSIDKYITLIKKKSEDDFNKSKQNLGNKKDNEELELDSKPKNIDNINNKSNGITKNDIMKLTELKLLNNNSDINNINITNNSGSILNNNIFNNKLLLSFRQKEKDLKGFEAHKELLNEQNEQNAQNEQNEQKEKEQEKEQDNQIEINNNKENIEQNAQNNISQDKSINNKEESNENKSDENESNENESEDELKDNIKKRNEYAELFNLNNMTSERKINTFKTDNTFTIWRENESNMYQEEDINEENSANEKLRQKFKLKDVLLQFILTEKEYRLLVQERAKRINPFKD